jgi:hypothetical protein
MDGRSAQQAIVAGKGQTSPKVEPSCHWDDITVYQCEANHITGAARTGHAGGRDWGMIYFFERRAHRGD